MQHFRHSKFYMQHTKYTGWNQANIFKIEALQVVSKSQRTPAISKKPFILQIENLLPTGNYF